MKRDMDLGRKILVFLEEKEDFSSMDRPEFDEYSKLQVCYQIKLLAESGLVKAKDLSTDDEPDWYVTSLTPQGHDFLDAARDDSTWQKAKELILSKGGALTFDLLKLALAETIKTRVFDSGT